MLATGTRVSWPLTSIRPLVNTWSACLNIRPPPITARRLMNCFRHNGMTAGGPDGWTPEELSAIPLRACVLLERFYCTIESGGRWPEQLVKAKCTYLGKGEGLVMDPKKQRGLLLLAVAYRTWAKC
eukprot:6958635-Alexandrium_andersonii.AAC.1